MVTELVGPDSTRYEQSNADVLLWQTRYRVVLALLATGVAVLLRTVGWLSVSPVASSRLGTDLADWLIGVAAAIYVFVVLGLHRRVQATRRASRELATFMMASDLLLVFVLVFVLAPPRDYDRALLIALFALQLTHVYFGRGPALLMLGATAAGYLLLVDVAVRQGGDIAWGESLVTLTIFAMGAGLVTLVQSYMHERLARLLDMFARAEDGDFAATYDVSADTRPDAITHVGRAYNRMRAHLADIVETDPLSGCLNRRGFEQQFRRELSRSARAQTELAIIDIDLDHFKLINDTHGHLAGDRVITEAGELLRANARVGDIVARTGGEEFSILAPGSGFAGAQHLALRIVEAFRRREFGGTLRIPVTVSVGVVSDTISDEGIAEDLLARADEALYAAKRSGRNRVVVWSQGLASLRVGQAPVAAPLPEEPGLELPTAIEPPRRAMGAGTSRR
jgi:diguanylate cyclase (GGDEF)-like protein